jgi:nitrous oxide reductase
MSNEFSGEQKDQSTSRREFLKTSALTLAAASVTSLSADI